MGGSEEGKYYVIYLAVAYLYQKIKNNFILFNYRIFQIIYLVWVRSFFTMPFIIFFKMIRSMGTVSISEYLYHISLIIFIILWWDIIKLTFGQSVFKEGPHLFKLLLRNQILNWKLNKNSCTIIFFINKLVNNIF